MIALLIQTSSEANDAALVPYLLLGAVVVGAVLLLLGFQVFRWKRREARGFPVAQESHNDGKLDVAATEEAIATQEASIGHIPAHGSLSGQDILDAPRPSPVTSLHRKTV